MLRMPARQERHDQHFNTAVCGPSNQLLVALPAIASSACKTTRARAASVTVDHAWSTPLGSQRCVQSSRLLTYGVRLDRNWSACVTVSSHIRTTPTPTASSSARPLATAALRPTCSGTPHCCCDEPYVAC
eukprot:scaffold65308_cov63-Phaeocystis_antarctica.AAC.2